MVNENQGKKYEPVPFYNRRLLRQMLRAQSIKKFGYHKTSAIVHSTFEKWQEKYRGKETANV